MAARAVIPRFPIIGPGYDRCAPLGRRLAAAAAIEAVRAAPSLQATLDLSTAVVGRLSTSREGPDRFAILRRIDNGILLEVFALALRELRSEGQRYYADCE